jgi:hypothetical protein
MARPNFEWWNDFRLPPDASENLGTQARLVLEKLEDWALANLTKRKHRMLPVISEWRLRTAVIGQCRVVSARHRSGAYVRSRCRGWSNEARAYFENAKPESIT